MRVTLFRAILMDTNVHASLPKSVEVDGFTVHKLKMSEYAQVFDKLQKLPELIGGLDLESPNAMLAALPRLVSTALPEVMEVLAVATHKSVEEIDETMPPKTAIKCLKAMLEINDFLGVWEEISAAMPKSLPQKPVKKG
jgi:hypothetical protein